MFRVAAQSILSLAASFAVTAIVFLAIGVDPLVALQIMASGAFGSRDGLGYTLFYATDYVLAGLAVALPYLSGHFNIGGEGQATVGGLAAALVCMEVGFLPGLILVPLAAIVAFGAGAVWAFLPALLQVRRGSNLVVTTIMFNFLASLLATGLLVGAMKGPGDPSPETVELAPAAWLPELIPGTPLNPMLIASIVIAGVVWLALDRTVWGYRLKVVGESPDAARYAAISVGRITIGAVSLGGGLAGLIAINEVLGAQHRLELGFTAGVGFVGIAVAFLGRTHPAGIVLSALLFGALAQGGSELALDVPNVSRDVIVAVNGLVILFCGALSRPWPSVRLRLRGRPA